MFQQVELFNAWKSRFHFRKLLYIVIAVAIVAAVILCVSIRAFANDSDSSNYSVVEEINLGDQGTFPAGHTLATIHVDDTVYTLDMDGVAEEDLQSYYGFTLSNQDYTEQTENEYGYDLYVNRLTVETTTEEVEVPFETERVADSSMQKGEEVVTTEGQSGLARNSYEVRTLNGEETKTLLSSETLTEAVNEVITYGTSEATPTGFKNHGSALDLTSDTIVSVDSASQVFTTANGKTYSYSCAVTCTGYAYCEPGGLTASGTAARQGAIAVDPSVIPLGSKLFVIASDGSVVYGEAVAEDTGGNIKGHTVDLFYNSDSLCRSFGRRSVTVYILN